MLSGMSDSDPSLHYSLTSGLGVCFKDIRRAVVMEFVVAVLVVAM